jgi:alpha-tubulin suppressor-like RCC1 family protein
VILTGTNFAGVTSVRFGAANARSFTVSSQATIVAVSPPGSNSVDVTVTTAAGTSATSSADLYDYILGPVLAWGGNGGRLGDEAVAQSDVPVEVFGLPHTAALSAGDASLALLKDGTVMASGINEIGEVGDGTDKRRLAPVHVCATGVTECSAGPYLQEVIAVAAGVDHSLALLKDGTVVGWGDDYQGQLGIGTEATESAVPAHVCTVSESPCKPEHFLSEVTAIAAGGFHSLALLKNGTVVAWGLNTKGELGDGTAAGPEKCRFGTEACSRTPVPVGGLTEVTAIAAGTEQSLALLKDGTVRAWGENLYGDLGDGTIENRDAPVAVCAAGEHAPCANPLREVTAIAEGWEYGLALLSDGTVKAWGENFEGELGDGTTSGPETCSAESPCSRTPVTTSGLKEVTAVAAGQTSTDSLALLKNGDVMAWGGNPFGILGNGTLGGPSDLPKPVCAPGTTGPCPSGPYLGGQVAAMAVGADHNLIDLTPAPTVTSIEPATGPRGGGTPVTIKGDNLNAATAVKFGETETGRPTLISPGEISVVTPVGTGLVHVTVTTPDGTSATSGTDEYFYGSQPSVVTGEATEVTSNAATVNATVDPRGTAVSACVFEYGPTTGYGSSVACTPSPGGGESPVAVQASLTGLAAYAEYHFRVAATNVGGTSYGTDGTFTTLLPNPPSVVTQRASRVNTTSATLNASVDPNGGEVTACVLEYGPTTEYGSRVPCSPAPGSGTTAVAVTGSVAALTPNTTYHFRAVATNAGGTAEGAAESFTTPGLAGYGTCAKTAKGEEGRYTARYEDKKCTVVQPAGEGKYEWAPAIEESNIAVTAKTKAVTLKSASVTVACKKSTSVGEITGPRSTTAVITYSGCATPAQPCTSPLEPVGAIKTGVLDGSLLAPQPGTVWTRYTSATSPDFAEFECGGVVYAVTGSVAAVDSCNVDVMSKKDCEAFAQGAGEQGLELEVVGGGREPATLTASSTGKAASKVEIKSSP